MEASLRLAFAAAQKTMGAHAKAMADIRKMFRDAGKQQQQQLFEAFFAEVRRFLPAKRRDAAVGRLVRFVGTLAGTLGDDFCVRLLRELCATSRASDRNVRLHSVQLVSSVLNSLPEDAEIDEETFEQVQASMLERARDKSPGVRAEAAGALARLQDPEAAADDPVVVQFRRMLAADPSPVVRRAVLEDIAVAPNTVGDIVRRTRDASDAVRAAAYAVIAAKLDMRSVSAKQRAALLRQGLGDRVDVVRRACAEMLRGAWLPTAAESDPVKLLSLLHPEEFSSEAEAAARCVVGGPGSLPGSEPLSPAVQSAPALPKQRQLQQHKKRTATQETEIVSPALALFWRVYREAWRSGEDDEEAETLSQLAEIVGLLTGDVYACSQLLLGACTLVGEGDEAGRSKMLECAFSLLGSLESDEKLVEPALKLAALLLGPAVDQKARLLEAMETLSSADDASEDRDAAGQVAQARSMLRRARLAHFLLCTCSDALSDPELLSIVEKVALPSVQSPDPAVREWGVRALAVSTLVGQLDAERAEAHMRILLHAAENDQGAVKVAAIESLFDLAATLGAGAGDVFDAIAHHLDVCEAPSDALASTAEGFAKLFFQGVISNRPELLAKLAVLLHHPATRKPAKLRQCLSVFFPAFVSGQSAVEHIRQLEAAVSPAICTAVDEDHEGALELSTKVAGFLISLLFSASAACGVPNPHAQIALELAERALSECEKEGPLARAFCHALSLCTISSNDASTIAKLGVLLPKISSAVDDAGSKKALAKMHKKLQQRGGATPSSQKEETEEEKEEEEDAEAEEETEEEEATAIIEEFQTAGADEPMASTPEKPQQHSESDSSVDVFSDVPSSSPAAPHSGSEEESKPAAKGKKKKKKKAKAPAKTTRAKKTAPRTAKKKSRKQQAEEEPESDSSVDVFSDVAESDSEEESKPAAKEKKTKAKAPAKTTKAKKTAPRTAKKKSKKQQAAEEAESDSSVDVFSDVAESDSEEERKPAAKGKKSAKAPSRRLRRLVRNSEHMEDSDS